MADECAYADILRRILGEDHPGWTQEMVWCAPHRQWHVLERAPGQVAMPMEQRAESIGQQGNRAGDGRRGRRGRLLADGRTMCFHENRSPALLGPCAYCGAQLHVHQDALRAVKSGRAEAGYLEERCPACHRANAVHPAYGLGGMRTAQIEAGATAMQMKLIR